MRKKERPPKVGIYVKLKRLCEEVFQDPLRLHTLFWGGLLLGGSNVEKKVTSKDEISYK